MFSIEKFFLKIRRQETPFYAFLYRMAKKRGALYLPTPKFWGNLLYYERLFRLKTFRRLTSFFYYEPMFRAKCVKVGKNLKLVNSGQGIPLISGDLKIYVGKNVQIDDRITLSGLKVFDNPKLVIGDNTLITDRVSIFVGKEVIIGDNCIISSFLLMDNPSHPTDPILRKTETVAPEDIQPVIVEDDAWLARGSIILKGKKIGKGSIVAANAVVTKDVEPYTIVAGNPAKIVGMVPHE